MAGRSPLFWGAAVLLAFRGAGGLEEVVLLLHALPVGVFHLGPLQGKIQQLRGNAGNGAVGLAGQGVQLPIGSRVNADEGVPDRLVRTPDNALVHEILPFS